MATKLDNISWLLGYYLDGWADLIEGIGDKAPEVRGRVENQLCEREMPDIEVEYTDIKEGFLSDLERFYLTTKTYPEARTIILIEKHGNDLYASWRSFIRPTINWRLVMWYAIAALAVSTIIEEILHFISIIGISIMVLQGWNPRTFFTASITWISVGGGIAIGLIIIADIISKSNNNSGFQLSRKFVITSFIVVLAIALFINGSGETMLNEINPLNASINAGMQSIFSPFIILVVGMNIFVGILIFVAVMGLIIRRNLLAFILKEPSVFDADDITAMNLSVHKSILRALDEVGINVSNLRLKREFKGGRSGETV